MIKRISTDDLEIGMYVCKKPANLGPNELEKNGFIKRKSTIYKLKEFGASHLLIDTSKGKDSELAFPEPQLKPQKPSIPLDTERRTAEKVYQQSLRQIHHIMSNAKLGKRLDLSPIEEVANQISQSILRNPFALLCLTQIRDNSQIVFEHSINAGILMGIFSQHLGYSEQESLDKIAGAILHDIGEATVPNQLLNKRDELKPDEVIELQQHVIYGQQILDEADHCHPTIVDMCGLHHEEMDGLGYPIRLKRKDININGRLIAIVDRYDAITSHRRHRDGLTPCIAMKKLGDYRGSKLDTALTDEFMKCFSIYPTGSLVELSNGRLGVVITPNSNDPENPFIRVFFNTRQRCYEPVQEIDLALNRKNLQIIRTLHPQEYGINLEDFI